ncbi:tRNA dihydrouridine synthase DusB [Acuticoccus sp. I52.16.1]|uniref:tRNA dihydrouridine synthase DusB n=1 Tax=Acuticoccus sp. I52.16.1 TaxID=2928472 RepID=UPI001FCFBFAF|nr:tRNA dihydrouridine synthase DusB [Acuticoccus sp. I52.16.1]UOM35215.1 tRNA dihydrouridine synthase DusB [Acuticoccus sp. I52.16.1]
MNECAVGNVPLSGRAILAPMSGVSDWPFRQLAARFGAGLVISEMVASDRLVAREAEARLKLEGDGLAIHCVQLAGCRPEDLAEAAKIAEGAGAHIIDINMGCPAKRVVGGWAGSALMRDPVHAASLVAATVRAVRVPVTVKMRLGYDRATLTAPELARRAVDAGAEAITVHGRTRCQRYTGAADWRAIAATRAAVSVPLVANGDIRDTETARAALALSGADAVMIGRAALGAPWLPGVVAADLAGRPRPAVPRTPAAIGALAREHAELLLAHAGPVLGLRLMRKHTAAYAEHVAAPPASRKAALTAEDPAMALKALDHLFAAADAPTLQVAA